jgi:hypothetical protein
MKRPKAFSPMKLPFYWKVPETATVITPLSLSVPVNGSVMHDKKTTYIDAMTGNKTSSISLRLPF